MDEIKTLWAGCVAADDALTSFGMAVSALSITLENLDSEGCNTKIQEDPAFAINFACRFQKYADALNLILFQLSDAQDTLRIGVKNLYGSYNRLRSTKPQSGVEAAP